MGRTLTPDQEIQQLKDLIREAHEIIKDLRAEIRTCTVLAKNLVTRFESTTDREIKQFSNFIRGEMNRHALELNLNVKDARQQMVRQLAASELSYNEQTGRWLLHFKAGRFDDNQPLPHPDQPVKDITP